MDKDQDEVVMHPQARMELMNLYTGMALQGLLAAGATTGPNMTIGDIAVARANSALRSLEFFHGQEMKRLKAEIEKAEARAEANLPQVEQGPTTPSVGVEPGDD